MSTIDLLSRIKPVTPGQQKLINALLDREKEIVGVFGPTGTGKSLLTVAYALTKVSKGEFEKFVLCRPMVDVVTKKELSTAEIGEQFILLAKQYLHDILSGYIDLRAIDELINSGKLVIADPHFLRGRTFDNAVIFLDDSQNMPPESAGELLMRMGTNSKFVVAGDPVLQKDLPLERDGATIMREALLGEKDATVIDLGLKDIVRPGARRGARILLEIRMRKRVLSEKEKEILEVIYSHAPDADVLTVVDIRDLKEKYGIPAELPDVLAISKAGMVGRLIGKGGEKISRIEEEVGLHIRAVEVGLDFRPLLLAIHPLRPKVERGIEDIDLAGPSLLIRIQERIAGPYFGPKGVHIRFVNDVFQRILGIGVRTEVVSR
ncbi:MAG: PhoH family protein [Candidatus Njordarchaeales archaeon]